MKWAWGREAIRSIGISLAITLVTLVALEIVLRVADFRELRETLSEESLAYDYDPRLGWAPVPGSTGTIKSLRTTHYKHNSMGLRDEEFSLDAKPTIVFLGDSFVWGLDSEAEERFSDLLKPRLPNYKIMAAGVGVRHRSGISAAAADMAEGEAEHRGADLLRAERPRGQYQEPLFPALLQALFRDPA